MLLGNNPLSFALIHQVGRAANGPVGRPMELPGTLQIDLVRHEGSLHGAQAGGGVPTGYIRCPPLLSAPSKSGKSYITFARPVFWYVFGKSARYDSLMPPRLLPAPVEILLFCDSAKLANRIEMILHPSGHFQTIPIDQPAPWPTSANLLELILIALSKPANEPLSVRTHQLEEAYEALKTMDKAKADCIDIAAMGCERLSHGSVG